MPINYRTLARRLMHRFSPMPRHIAYRRERERLRTKPTTQLVLDGFPRCANTFAVLAFELAQKHPVEVAHHHHSPEQILDGIRLSLPVCVLIREPEAAIRSLLVRNQALAAEDTILRYNRLYSAIRPFSDRFIVATFDQVTANFPAVIGRINQRFLTNFDSYQDSETFRQRVFDEIDEQSRRFHRGRVEYLSRPHALHDNLQRNIDLSPHADLLKDSRKLYDEFRQLAETVVTD